MQQEPKEKDYSTAQLDNSLAELTVQEDFENEPLDQNFEIFLSFPLQFLFALNGATLSLPTTALMYIVNTRASIPITYLSVYGALSFLPNSFKPLYAYLTEFFPRRDKLLAGLLLLSGISIAATSLVPKGGITICFIAGFVREVFSAWPELLLGISMLEEAQQESLSTRTASKSKKLSNGKPQWLKMSQQTTIPLNFDTIAARYQSQAATARNIGSWGATVGGLFIFLYRHYTTTAAENELDDLTVNLVLVLTGVINILGAIFAWLCHVGYRQNYSRLESTAVPYSIDDDISSTPTTSPGERANSSRLLYGDTMLIVLLQLLVVIFAMRSPLIGALSELAWYILLITLATGMLVTAGLNCSRWNRRHRVGIFLIARHAIPTSGYLMASFVYELFQSSPLFLQAFGLFALTISTLSSWSYGKLLAPFSTGGEFIALITGTTLLASVLSLLDIIVIGLDKNHAKWILFCIILATTTLSTFVSEWNFLPSIVLATTAVSLDEDHLSTVSVVDENEANEGLPVSYQRSRVSLCQCKASTATSGMQYGALVSCIDFGDQIGSWLTLPLVGALGISRENDWENMNSFIIATSILSLLPLTLLPMIKD